VCVIGINIHRRNQHSSPIESNRLARRHIPLEVSEADLSIAAHLVATVPTSNWKRVRNSGISGSGPPVEAFRMTSVASGISFQRL
jgi:hypothetical protein